MVNSDELIGTADYLTL